MKIVLLFSVCIAACCDAAIAEDDLWECDIHADEGWQSAGVVLRSGRTYLMTSTGTWTTSDGSEWKKTNPFGPDGGGATSGFGFFKVNKSFGLGCLMGSVGGKEYEVGSFAVVRPRTSGQLRFRINDTATSDNDGKVHVTIEQLSSNAAADFDKAFRVRPNLGKDRANSGWQKSSFDLRKGQSIKFEFYGKWTTSPYTGTFGPEGGGMTEDFGPDAARDFRLVPGVKVGALIGRFGYGGRPFAVNPKGKDIVNVTADTSGSLYFNINDTLQFDNGGAIVVVPVSD